MEDTVENCTCLFILAILFRFIVNMRAKYAGKQRPEKNVILPTKWGNIGEHED